MTQEYRVEGMSCAGCVRALTRAITGRHPGAAVSVDLAAGRVAIAGEVPEAAIAAAVGDAGFVFAGRVEPAE